MAAGGRRDSGGGWGRGAWRDWRESVFFAKLGDPFLLLQGSSPQPFGTRDQFHERQCSPEHYWRMVWG